jgi:hypothetical protein
MLDKIELNLASVMDSGKLAQHTLAERFKAATRGRSPTF